MWYHTLDEQHEEKMNLLKEQQKTLSEIADLLRKLIAQQTKDNIKSDSNPSKPKDEDRSGVTQGNTNLLNNLPADHIFL